MFRFEKFDVWHRAVDFASEVYSATARFPADERFGLTSQMRRAAVSNSSNIAEGSARATDQEFARFVEIAYESLMEVVSQSLIAKRQGLLAAAQFETIYGDAERIARQLSNLRSALHSERS